ncbi:MAG: prepilin-type N-terminal cleavage/methylation domain-containing protein [Planctomycetaceae bacterium]|nr:prepilin-type N-terminal cleavage/methylation domain-containing protein [Planctomycetaceae bacterium]
MKRLTHSCTLVDCNWRAGFTLFELLLTTAILAAMLGIALPSVTRIAAQQRFLSETGDVVKFLNEVRRKSIQENQSYDVYFVSSGEFIISGPSGSSFDSKIELGEDVLFSEAVNAHQLSEEILDSAPADWLTKSWSPVIMFRPDGTSSDSEFSIEDINGRIRTIRVRGLTGQVTLESI